MNRKHCNLRWFQFTLRTLFVFMLIVSVGLSWLAVKMQRCRRQREAVEAIGSLGGWVCYEDPLPGPVWVRQTFGIDSVSDVHRAGSYSSVVSDVELQHLEALNSLRELVLANSQVTDAGLAHLKEMSDLQRLSLEDTRVGDVGLEHLNGLTSLEVLSLEGTLVTDDGLEHLKALTRISHQ